MITQQILRSSSSGLSRFLYQQVVIRSASTASKDSQNKSTNTKPNPNKGGSEYQAADMYDYTAFSYYDIEVDMTKFRLPQPSAYASLKPSQPAPAKN